MSWFDSQLRQRIRQDDSKFADALDDIAGAVMGKRLSDAMTDRAAAQSAIDEVLKCYHIKPSDSDEELENDVPIEEILDKKLRPHGILRRRVKLDECWEQQAIGPMLGTLKESGALVALVPDHFFGYCYVDFSTGKHIRIDRKNRSLIDQDALCFYRPLPLKSLTIKDLLLFMYEQLSVADIALYVGMMAVMSLLGLLSPMFTGWLFGSVLKSGSGQVLAALACFMVCYSVCRMLISIFQSMVNERIGVKQSIAVQAAVMNRIISLPVGFFHHYSSGELYQRAMHVQSLCSTMMNTIGTTGLMSVFSLIYVVQIFTFAPALVVPALCIILLTLVVSVTTTLMQMQITRQHMQHSSATSGLTYAMITGIQKIKLAGAEKRMFARWASHYAKEAALTYNPPTFIKLNSAINLAVTLGGVILLYAAALQSKVSVADYYAFNTAYGMVSAAFASLAGIARAVANIKPTLEMAKPIMEAVPEVSEGKKAVKELYGAITLENVSFHYEDSQKNIINDLSLSIQPGEYLAIVGTTGCGKSTLLRLLLGFETPQSGTIYYDHYNMDTIDKQTLRRKIGTVMQNGKLFSGDIYENIVISAPQLTRRDAWEAARIAAIDEDIRAMPMGMNTMISEGQGGISGGQKQRLMIARAIAPKPKILIFDEATSALDNITQKKVSDAIDSMHCTRIVVAHRLSTIRHCDRIIVLDQGRVAEDGTYEQLIERNGIFADLVARQRVEETA